MASQIRIAFSSMAWNTGSQLARRAADDLQHLRGRGLLLQRLGQFARARLHLIEQPHVLDRDHRLVGERLDQLDLLVRERTHCGAREHNRADHTAFAHERDSEHSAIATNLPPVLHRIGTSRNCVDVRNMDGCGFKYRPSEGRVLFRRERATSHELFELEWKAVAGDKRVIFTDPTVDGCPIRLAQLCGRLNQRIEHRLQIEGRATDDLEHVGGGGLLLQRLAELRVRACTSSNSRTFSIAITAWSAKVVTSSICLSVNGRYRLALKDHDSNRQSFPQQRHSKYGADFQDSTKGEFRVSQYIRHMDGPAFQDRSPGDRAPSRDDLDIFHGV